jgi:hypothetical protein
MRKRVYEGMVTFLFLPFVLHRRKAVLDESIASMTNQSRPPKKPSATTPAPALARATSPENSFWRLDHWWNSNSVAFAVWFIASIASLWAIFDTPSMGVSIAILGGIGAIMTTRTTMRPLERAGYIIVITVLLIAEIFAIQRNNREESTTRTDQIRRLGELKDETAEAIDMITGGDSSGYVTVLPLHILPQDPNKVLLGITNESDKYAMRSVRLIIINTSLLINNAAAVQVCDVGDVPPHFGDMPLASCPVLTKPGVRNHFFMTINANNGSVSETLYLDPKEGGGWKGSGSVSKESKVIKRF